ncbi:hypothetical protein SAMN05880593_11015 [Rhizobium sp. RU36D]|nr:hypothetical protein SAMN05880593_11015 [Rhizobium sp. RU36D]
MRTDPHRWNELEAFAIHLRGPGNQVKRVGQFIQIAIGLIDRPPLRTVAPYLFDVTYSAVRQIWRTKVRCSALYLLHNLHLKSIPI